MSPDGDLDLRDLLEEGRRQFAVCNACRYCEGYCAVFPAMERMSLFTEGDLGYLANLCHDCRGCYQACMYTAPHEFALNIPELMSKARVASYRSYARPRLLARLFAHSTFVLSVFTVASIVLVIGLYQLFGSVGPIWETTSGPNSFYRVVSHTAMALPAALLSVVVLGAIAWGLVVSMREGGMTRAEAFAPRVWSRAVLEAVTLHWLGGGGGDCYFPEAERASPTRRVLHHVVAYGFLLTFLSTVSAAFMGYALGERPPYAVLSVPVILGAVGGVGVLVGATAFLILNGRNPTGLTAPTSAALDSAFLVALILVCATGIALLVVQKGVGVVHVVLLVHLATILMFYITIPYGKLMHGVYRFGALLRNARDTRAAG